MVAVQGGRARAIDCGARPEARAQVQSVDWKSRGHRANTISAESRSAGAGEELPDVARLSRGSGKLSEVTVAV